MFSVGENQVRLLTTGYLAIAIGRTPWTIKYWQRMGLLPPPPFAIHQNDVQRRRWLYPEPFVDAVSEIVGRRQIGTRLDREDWPWFREEIVAAYEMTVEPLLSGTCTGDLARASI